MLRVSSKKKKKNQTPFTVIVKVPGKKCPVCQSPSYRIKNNGFVSLYCIKCGWAQVYYGSRAIEF